MVFKNNVKEYFNRIDLNNIQDKDVKEFSEVLERDFFIRSLLVSFMGVIIFFSYIFILGNYSPIGDGWYKTSILERTYWMLGIALTFIIYMWITLKLSDKLVLDKVSYNRGLEVILKGQEITQYFNCTLFKDRKSEVSDWVIKKEGLKHCLRELTLEDIDNFIKEKGYKQDINICSNKIDIDDMVNNTNKLYNFLEDVEEEIKLKIKG